MRSKWSILAILAGLLLPQGLIFAHHGTAGYDTGTPVTVSGTVTDFKFVNPHSIISFDVKDDKGETQKWQAELTSPNHLVRAGWTATSLKAGDKVKITGWRAKSGANSLWATKTIVNGEELTTAAGN